MRDGLISMNRTVVHDPKCQWKVELRTLFDRHIEVGGCFIAPSRPPATGIGHGIESHLLLHSEQACDQDVPTAGGPDALGNSGGGAISAAFASRWSCRRRSCQRCG